MAMVCLVSLVSFVRKGPKLILRPTLTPIIATVEQKIKGGIGGFGLLKGAFSSFSLTFSLTSPGATSIIESVFYFWQTAVLFSVFGSAATGT